MTEIIEKSNTDFVSEVFFQHLKKVLKQSKALQGQDYTDRELSGFCRKLIDVFNSASFEDGKYQIYASNFSNLKRNKLSEHVKVFTRSEDSTYHANNSKKGYNGYTHSYDVADWFIKIRDNSLKDARRQIEFNAKYARNHSLYKDIVRRIKKSTSKRTPTFLQNIDEVVILEKEKFLSLYDAFMKREFDYFDSYRKNVVFFNKDKVYVSNTVTSKKIDKYGGLGRQYTLISNTKKEVRRYILEGYTEIDFNNCAISILSNLWLNDILNKDSKNDISELIEMFPNVHRLLTNKKAFYEKYERILDTDEKTVKKILLHLTYHPKATTVSKNFTDDELENFAIDALSQYELTEPHKGILFGGLTRELIMMGIDVISTYYDSELKSSKVQKLNISELDIRDVGEISDQWFLHDKSEDDKSDRRVLARIIELTEHQLRKVVINKLIREGFNNIFQIHDAVIFDGDIDVATVEKEIFDVTGFVMKLSKEKY